MKKIARRLLLMAAMVIAGQPMFAQINGGKFYVRTKCSGCTAYQWQFSATCAVDSGNMKIESGLAIKSYHWT